jgi:DNA-binding Lrp family transcriptional regulator
MMLAFVFVECAVGMEAHVKQAVERVQGVLEAHATTGGVYDLVVKIDEAESKLRDIVQQIRNIQGVGSALTSIVYADAR